MSNQHNALQITAQAVNMYLRKWQNSGKSRKMY